MGKLIKITIILAVLLEPYSCLDCETPLKLGYDRESFIKCETLLSTHGKCEDKKHIKVAIKVMGGYQHATGELEYDATLITECTTMPMRMGRNVMHKVINKKFPTEDRSLPVQDPNRLTYPGQTCSWNWFSTSVVETKTEVRLRSKVMAVISPFQNLIKVEDSVCDEEKKIGISKIRAKCDGKIWTSDGDRSDISSKVVKSMDLNVCPRDGKLVEYETGIVLGKENYCLIIINSESYLLTSDHLLIKPDRDWNISSILECADKKIEVIDEDSFISKKLDEESYLQSEGEMICRTLLSCGKNCNDTNLINVLNKYEFGKPGRFFQINKTNSDYLMSSCYHDIESERTDLSRLRQLRDNVTKTIFDMLLKKSERNSNIELIEDENTLLVIPTVVKEHSYIGWITSVILFMVLLVIMCKVRGTMTKKRTKRNNNDSVRTVIYNPNDKDHPLKGII